MGDSGAFQRPTAKPKRVWYRHKSFRVEDIPDHRREEAIKHMMENFFQDEPTSTALRKTDAYSDDDIKTFINNALDENISLYAVDEDNGEEIAGVTVLRVASRAAPHRHERSDSSLSTMKKLFAFLLHCHEGVDTFTYGDVVVDHVLEPMGLSVSPKYRGKGIGQALIQARHKMAIEMGIGATMGIYTSIFSQAIILRQGMETIREVPYAGYLVDGVAMFAELDPPHPSAKLIGGLLPRAT